MKKRYNFKFSPTIYVLTAIINVLLLVVIIVNSLRLASVGELRSINKALDISAIVLSVIIMVVVELFVFASSYKIKDDYLLYSLGFFRFKIKYNNIFLIREEKTTHAMVINYQRIIRDKDGNENSGISGLVININNKDKGTFVEALRERNSAIIYEVIDKKLSENN